MPDLDATVVVASHDRPVRLRWLLNALADQSYSPRRFDVVVGDDSRTSETDRVVTEHPLTGAGRLHHLRFAPGSRLPGANRNPGWRAANGELILFTDDDCRPARDWVERAVRTAADHPGAIVQGRTDPDPDEAEILRAVPWARTISVEPPSAWAETCNIAYPRRLLERLGGFDEGLAVGEDADLAARARRIGARIVADRDMLVYHAVEPSWLGATIGSVWRWQHLPRTVKRHRELRRALLGGIWWKPEHAAFAAAVAGAALGTRRPQALAMGLPWIGLSMRHRGFSARGLLRSLSELPGHAAIDGCEMGALALGSLRYRTVML